MVRVAFAKRGPLLPKEEEHWRVPSVIGFAVVHCGLSSVGGASRLDAIVRVVADDDGVVPGCPDGGAPQSPVLCSTLQMTAPSRIPWSGRTSPMESVALQP